MCRLGQGEAREWSTVARRSHRGADRADVVFRFRARLGLPKMEVAKSERVTARAMSRATTLSAVVIGLAQRCGREVVGQNVGHVKSQPAAPCSV